MGVELLVKRTIPQAVAETVVKFPKGTREERETQGIEAQRKTIDKQFENVQRQTDKLIEELFK